MKPESNFRQGLGYALRMGTEMVVAIGLGGLMGYTADYLLDTRPWFLALGVLFGGAAGMLNVYRAAREMQEAVPPSENGMDSKKGPSDKDPLSK